MGFSPQRLDAVEKVTGSAKYAADIRIPDMLYARLLRPPTHGSILLKVDMSAVNQLPGITVVNEGGLVAVLHADPEAADDAAGRIKASWHAAAS